ncbi:MAG: rod shape-determining protein MreD [Peptoniphilaceae bacterium]|nr:rod shape-determining protein MreD [Peptoniphilaceae bacterium]MDY6018578.1 rod shape-determining protein MreD [Anaerococcus sp.]
MNRFKTFFLLLVTFILQTTIFSKIDIFGANINLILPLLISLSQILGAAVGARTGLTFGLLEDIMFSNIIGVRALVYYLLGHFVGSNRLRSGKDKNSGLILTFIFTFISFALISIINFIFNNDISVIKNYLFAPLFSEAILNMVFYLIYYKIIRKIMYIPTYRI